MSSPSRICIVSLTLTLLFSIALGSSGAWVVRGDKLCGYIVAIRQDVPWAYMVAIQPVLEDIGRRFKTDDVRLPSAAEIESLRLVAKGQEVESSKGQEEIQALDSEDNQPTIKVDGLNETRKGQGGLTSRNTIEVPGALVNELPSMIKLPDRLLGQNPPVNNEKSPPSNGQDQWLNEMPSLDSFRPIHFELIGEENVPRPYPRGQGVSIHSSSTRNDNLTRSLIASVPPQTDLEAAFQAPLPNTHRLTFKRVSHLSLSRQFTKRSGQIWHGFETLILRIECWRRRERSSSSAFLVRMMWYPLKPPDCSWMQRRIDRGLNYLLYYTVFVFGNILLNFLYWIFLFPIILLVRYRHYDVLEGSRTRREMPSFTEIPTTTITELPPFTELPAITEMPTLPELLAFIRRYDEGEEVGCYKPEGMAVEGSSRAELAQHS